MNRFKKAKYAQYYDKVGIDHDNIKKNTLNRLFFNMYYFFYHEKRNSIVYKTDTLIIGSNILLDILLAYKLAYLEIEQYLTNKIQPKTITVFYNKNMDFWNYNIPTTPLFKNLLEKKLREFNFTHQNILSSPLSNSEDRGSQLFNYITNESNHKTLDNKKMIKAILEDLHSLNKINDKPFIQFINLNDYQFYNTFNVSKVCKKRGLKNDSYLYDNVLRLASLKEVEKLKYPKEYEYLKENLKRASSYEYLYEDFEKLLQSYNNFKLNMINAPQTTLCPDYKVLTYYILSQNIFFTSSVNLHPWAELKISPSYKNNESKEVFQKTLHEFDENYNENFYHNINNQINNQSHLKIHETQLIENVEKDYFNNNNIESMKFDYSVQVLNQDKTHNFFGSSRKIANSAYSFMSQPMLDIENIFSNYLL